MKIFKRALATVLCVVMIFGSVPLAGFVGLELPEINLFGIKAEATTSGTCGESLTWTFDEATGELAISGEGYMYDFESLSETPWCEYTESIKSVVISDGVTFIGGFAFSSCTALTNVTIPESVSYIGFSAFESCSGLTSVNIPDGVTEIGMAAFGFCTGLKDIKLPDSLTHIGAYAFKGCDSLTNITIPDSVISIGGEAFFSCDSLTSITIPDGVTCIEDLTFAYCVNLTDITIGNGVTKIGKAFCGCKNLTSITIPYSVEIIADHAFGGCTSLTDVYFTGKESEWEKITIESYNDNLLNAAIHFNENPRILTGTYNDNITWILDEATGVLIVSGDGEIERWDFEFASYVTELIISDGVTGIGVEAFCSFSNLIRATIPDSVNYIGDYAFAWCCFLEEISLPDKMEYLGANAFECCDMLSEAIVPDGVNELEGTFIGCYSLSKVTLPASITLINGAFDLGGVLSDICFQGSRTQWNNIEISDDLSNVNIYYAFSQITWNTGEKNVVDFYEPGSSVTVPETPVKEGCTFVGWDAQIPETAPEYDLVITAEFTPNSYTVTWIVDGEETVVDYNYGDIIVIPETPTKEHYTFMGWGAEIPETVPDEDLVFTAQWELNKHTVIWTVDSRETVDVYSYGDEIVIPEPPEKEGYTFAGWGAEIPATVPDEDLIFTAQWELNKHTVTWIVDGDESVVEYNYGEEIVVTETPEKEGYAFAGWTPEIPSTMPDNSLEFTAVFIPNPHTVTWIVDGEETVVEYSYGDKIVIPETPVKTGYDFIGWGAEVPATVPDEDLVFTAQWEISEYTVTWNVDGEKTVVEYIYGDEIVIPESPVKEGYTFNGWTPAVPDTMPEQDLEFTATWLADVITGTCGDNAMWSLTRKTGELVITGTGEIYDEAFRNNNTIKSVKISEGITKIGAVAFSDCSNLTSVSLPDSLTVIEDAAFEYCINLSEINLPDSIKRMGINPFRETAYCYNDDNREEDGSLYIGNYLLDAVQDGEYYIREGTKAIADGALANKQYSKLVIPAGVEYLGKNLFEETSISELVMPYTVRNISDYLFGDYGSGSIGMIFYTGSASDRNKIYFEGDVSSYRYQYVKKVFEQDACWEYNSHGRENDGEYEYTVNKFNEAVITHFFGTCSGELVIPETLGGYPVTAIGENVYYNQNITSVNISEKINRIGDSAFANCENLNSITLPDTPIHIGREAFYGTGYYNNEANWEDDILYIGNHLIANKSGFTKIKEGTLDIAYNALAGTSATDEASEKLLIPYGVEYIENEAFYYIQKTSYISIPDTVTHIAEAAFAYNSCVKKVRLSSNLTEISAMLFNMNKVLETVTIPQNVEFIGVGAFADCYELNNIVLPKKLTMIAEQAFYGCKALTDVYYEGTEEEWNKVIGKEQFGTATIHFNYEYEEVYCEIVTDSNEPYAVVTGCDQSLLKNGGLEIPSTYKGYPVKEIAENAFENCNSIKYIIIPDSVTTIGKGAFIGCEEMIAAHISISDYCQTIVIPENCFLGCTSLETVYISTEYTISELQINGSAFTGCSSLKDFYCYVYDEESWNGFVTNESSEIAATTIHYDYQPRNYFSCYDGVIEHAFYPMSGTVLIPPVINDFQVNEIRQLSYEVENVTKVIIPNSVKIIGEAAFRDFKNLTDIIWGSNVEVIGEQAFGACAGLTKISIPDSVTTIGERAFEMCENLAVVDFSNNLTSIGAYAFMDCYNIKSIELPDSLTHVGEQAFSGCRFTELTIPGAMTSIDEAAFRFCDCLVYLTISDGVTNIENGAFECCGLLSAVSIPSSVTHIGNGAFNSTNITDVYYSGSEEEWSKISIEDNNDCLLNASIHFNTCEIPFGFTFEINENGLFNLIGIKNVPQDGYVVIPETIPVEKISDRAFADCTDLKAITIPYSIIEIGENAFQNCSNLTDVYYEMTKTNWNEIAVSEIGNECLLNANIHFMSICTEWLLPGKRIVMYQTVGEPMRTPVDPTREDYVFIGWSPNVPEIAPEGDIVFTALWEGIYDQTVTWIVDGEETVVNYKNGDKLVVPETPTKEGYTFVGWGAEIPDVVPKESLTFTAQWKINKHTITWMVDDEKTVVEYNYGDEIIVPENPTKEGYTFAGWGAEIPEKAPDEDLVFTSQWKINKHTVTWIVDGEETVDEYSYGDEIIVPENPAKEGYTFESWGTEIPATVPDEDLVFTSQWKINKHTVTWIVDGEETVDEYNYGDEISFPETPTKEGYTFAGWGSEIPATVPDEDLVFTSQWKINKHTVTWIADGEETVDEYSYGDEIVVPENPSKEGYTFADWGTEIPETVPDEDLVFTAQWIINKHTVTWRFDGKETVDEYSYGDEIVVPENPTKEGYTFAGWGAETPETVPDEDLVFIAQWEINKHTVTWRFDGKETVDEYSYGDEIVVPENPAKEGYTFAGWGAEIPTTVPDEDLIFTAQWEINTYTVTWIVDGEKTDVEYNFGGKIDVYVPQIDGLTFVEWTPDVPDTMPAENLEFTAVFECKSYTVDWIIDGLVMSETYKFGDAIDKTKTFNKKGYTFVGWSPEIPDTMPTRNLEFTAVFEANLYDAVFYTNGGIFPDGDSIKRVPTAYNTTITIPKNPEKTGYEFAGWAYNGKNIGANLGVMDSIEGKTFEAIWASNNTTLYKVETYTMSTLGEYELSSMLLNATAFEEISVNPVASEGFEVNTEKSVLKGIVSPEETLVLKVYLDRKQYSFTTIINNIKSSALYYYGSIITEPATPIKDGYVFVGWDAEIPATMPANDVTVTAKFKTAPQDITTPRIVMVTPETRTIYYGESITLQVRTYNLPDGARVKWEVSGDGVSIKPSSSGKTCKVTSTSNGNVVIRAYIVDSNGNTIAGKDGKPIYDFEYLYSEVNLWQIIVNFIRQLFGKTDTVSQIFRVIY